MRTPLLRMFGMMFLIVLFLTCSPKTPTAPETGRVELDIQFPAAADSHTVAKNQEPGYTLTRIHIMITNSSGENIVSQDLSKSVSNFEGTFEVESGSGYTVSLDCYESSLLVFKGSRSNVSVSAGQTTTVTVSLTATVGTMTDQDGNVYQTVKIGDQWWMAENLKVTHYRDGTAIPNVTDDTEWTNLSSGAYCVYDNDDSNADTYGYLYNWYAASDTRNIAPSGWHVPTDEEWKELEITLGMSNSEADSLGDRGTNEGSKLAGQADLWFDGDLKNNAAFGESGFSALPGGYRRYYDGYFYYLGYGAHFWSATEYSSYSAWFRHLYYYTSEVDRCSYGKQVGFSVRLVRD